MFYFLIHFYAFEVWIAIASKHYLTKQFLLEWIFRQEVCLYSWEPVYLMALHCSCVLSNICLSTCNWNYIFLIYLSDFGVRIYHRGLKLMEASIELAVSSLWENDLVKCSGCSDHFLRQLLWELSSVVSLMIGYYDIPLLLWFVLAIYTFL